MRDDCYKCSLRAKESLNTRYLSGTVKKLTASVCKMWFGSGSLKPFSQTVTESDQCWISEAGTFIIWRAETAKK